MSPLHAADWTDPKWQPCYPVLPLPTLSRRRLGWENEERKNREGGVEGQNDEDFLLNYSFSLFKWRATTANVQTLYYGEIQGVDPIITWL